MNELYKFRHKFELGTPYSPYAISNNSLYFDTCPSCYKRGSFDIHNKDLSLVIETDPTSYCIYCDKTLGDHYGDYCNGFGSLDVLPDYLILFGSGLNIISEKALKIWGKHNVTGYEAFPIKKLLHYYNEIEERYEEFETETKYYNAIITKQAEFDYEQMGIKKIIKCPVCGDFEYSKPNDEINFVALKKGTYENSDLISVGGAGGYSACTEKLLEITHKHKLTGFGFLALDDMFKYATKHLIDLDGFFGNKI